MAVRVSRSDVIAFRLHAHHLTERVGGDRLLDAAGACGIQNSPPGSALLALNARLRALSREAVDDSIAGDKSLMQSWCMRGAPFFFPTADAAVFTTGALPPTEAAMRRFLPGVVAPLDRLGLTLADLVARCAAEIPGVLTGCRLAIAELGAALAGRVAGTLTQQQCHLWDVEGPYAAGQPLGEAIVHFCLRILTLQGLVCFAPREGGKAPFVLVDEWLGGPIPDADPQSARAGLLRRYLHCYGPSTRTDFAAWLGVGSGDADAWWRLVADEVVPVESGRRAWMLAEDLEALRSAPNAQGVRLLPPHDPYTQMRDRGTIVAEEHHRHVWKAGGAPGTVLVDGEIAGVWRPRKSRRTLTVTVTGFDPLPPGTREALRVEAEQVASLRGATSTDLVVLLREVGDVRRAG